MTTHVEKIHAASLRILKTCGLQLYDVDDLHISKDQGYASNFGEGIFIYAKRKESGLTTLT